MKLSHLLIATVLSFLSILPLHAQDTLSPGMTCYADIIDDWKDQDGVKSSVTPSGPINIALNKTATQSSVDYGGTPERAVDGNTSGVFGNNSITQTLANPQEWWQVDLGSASMIDSIAIYNRTDCCGDRLTNFVVKLSSNGTIWTDSLVMAGQCGTPSVFKFGKTGRYVRVQLKGTNPLSLAEVQVFSGYSNGTAIADPGYRAAISRILPTLPAADRTLLQPRFDALASAPDSSAAMAALYVRACSARRAYRMTNYVSKFQKLLFSEHNRLGGAYFFDGVPWAGGVGGKGLGMLTMNGYYGSVTQLLSSGEARHPDVSFDGTRAVFSWRGGSSGSGDYHLYEMDLSTRVTRQLTTGSGEFTIDLDPCYLPNGNIVFVSSRFAQEVDCINGRVLNLFLCDKDGKYMRQIGFDQVPILYPRVLPSGQVMYERWDYNDKAHSYAHALFTMNPDGTAQQELCNNNSWWPTNILQARPIPGTTKIMAMIGGYHTPQWGKIGIVDPNIGRQNGAGVTLVAPVRTAANSTIDVWGSPTGGPYAWRAEDAASFPRAGVAPLDRWGQTPGRFAYPYPFDENAFLVSHRPASKETSWGPRMALYFMTIDGTRELLYSDPTDSNCSIMSAVPALARPVPNVLPSSVNYKDSTGVFQIMNIYLGQSLTGVPAGTIKRLRVVELYFRPGPIVDGGASYVHCGAGDINYGGASYHTAIATTNASWDAKWIVGEIPVESDGSASFIVPARKPLFFQALNDKGQVVQTMRSWSTLQPGETFSCMGCHESKLQPPPPLTYVPIALKQAPKPLEPFYGPRRAFNFEREVQPILNAKCVSCHSGSAPKGGLKLSTTRVTYKVGTGMFESYLNLVNHGNCESFSKYVNWFNAEDSPILQPPSRAGSIKSMLDSQLTKGHQGIVITDEEMRKIRCWIDLGVPYWGRYEEGHPGSEANLTKRAVWLAQEKTNIAAFLKDFPVGTVPQNFNNHSAQSLNNSKSVGLFCSSLHSNKLVVSLIVRSSGRNRPVSVQLFDVRGKVVKTVVNQSLPEGNHDFEVDRTMLASGRYLIRMKAPGAVDYVLPIVMIQ